MNKIFISTLIVALSTFSNVALSVPLIQPTTKPVPVTVTPTPTTTPSTGTTSGSLVAIVDTATVVPGKKPTVSGNVTSNDKGFASIALIDSQVSKYGYLDFDSTGAYTYTIFDSSPEILALQTQQVLKDQFRYTIYSGIKSVTSTLTITIIGNPLDASGNSIYAPLVDNVEIEGNNSSAQATPLNDGQMIKGHLYASNDRDWYSLASTGNEIIHIEVCAKGSVCYGKKNWVMYVFDGSMLTPGVENAEVPLTQTQKDNNTIVNAYPADSMYLAYQFGEYEKYENGKYVGPLVGIVDPCFGDTNSVDIGSPSGARTYFVAISVPLKGDGSSTDCGVGNLVFKKDGQFVDLSGVSHPTTDQYVVAFPNSDDEYAIKLSLTGNDPLAHNPPTTVPASAYASSQVKIPSFNEKQHLLTIPKLRILNDLYTATLSYKGSLLKMNNDSSQVVTMTVKKLTGLLEPLSGDPNQGTFNPDNDQVVLSKIIDSKTGETYSVVLQYHLALDKKPLWLEVISISKL
jgi:VCBS repeat-containing protein